MKKSPDCYDALSDKQKTDIIYDLYTQQHLSFADIAKLYDTYPNKVRRDAKKLNIKIRDKSQAQKNALQSGKHKHPTKGCSRSEEVKHKIGAGVIDSWKNLDLDELNTRKQKAKDNWSKMSEDEKEYMKKRATDAVRYSSKVGSKLEKYILSSLIRDGLYVEFHKEQVLVNTKLQIDLFLPKMNIAIEVDGPSHFLPVWGEDVLQKNIEYDQKKEGLILGKGWHLIRIKQLKDFCNTRANILYLQLIDKIKELNSDQNSIPKKIIIED
jgi:very-short-patch-repair endonuclease